MTSTATITSKRQLTIPVRFFEALGFSAGDKLTIDIDQGGLLLRKASTLVDKIAGSVNVASKVTIDEAISAAKKSRFSQKKGV